MSDKTVGVVMIVKNEEEMLGRCLETVKDADEIVICDTGSEDNTVEIAKRYTDRVYTDYQWEKHFAKARNHAKLKATKDWILSIDADEVLESPFVNVRQAIENAFLAVDCRLYAQDNNQFNFYPRLFRNSPHVWWEGAAHNHLNVAGEFPVDVRIRYGYSPAHLKDPNRTMEILEREVAANPRALREMFYLGREYYYRNRFEDAVRMLWRYAQDPECKHLAEKAEAYLVMARCCMALKKVDEARDAVMNALILNANFKEAAQLMAFLAGDGSGVATWQRNADQWNRLAATASNEGVLFVRT